MVKVKFHYTSWFGAGSEPVRSLFGASSELASVMEFGFYAAKSSCPGTHTHTHPTKCYTWTTEVVGSRQLTNDVI